jgi:hypothetical protein
MVDVKVAGGNLLHGIQQKMHEVFGGQPFAQITGQKHRRLAVKINEAGRHENQSQHPAFCSIYFHFSYTG